MFKSPFLATALCCMIAISSFTHANEHEKTMQGMMQMQRCMTENIDVSYLETMAANGDKIANSIEQLCHTGQRQEAQDTAMDYAEQMQNDSNFQALKPILPL